MKYVPAVRIVVGGLATAGLFWASAAVASADSSVLDPLVNTTCNYAQITAALKAEAPDLSSLLNGRPQAQTRLQQFLALPTDQRREHLDQQLAANPMAESMIEAQLSSSDGQEVIEVANTCNRY
jgi:hemophore-related protein